MTKVKKKKRDRALPLPPKPTPLIGRQTELWLLSAIILIAVFVRLLFVFEPLLDFHSQRQTQTADNARNYYRYDMNFFHPRFLIVDINGEAPGVTGMEFPIYQYSAALLYKVFGVHEYLGRLLSILAGLGTLAFTYLLGRRYIGVVGGLAAALFYAINPVAVFFNRTYQPDATGLLFFTGGLYFLLKWFDEKDTKSLAYASVLTALATSIKPPYLVILVPVFLYKTYSDKLWVKDQRAHLFRVSLFAVLSVGAALLWYYYAYVVIFAKTGLILKRGAYPGEHVRTWEYWLDPRLYTTMLTRLSLLLTPLGAVLTFIGLAFVAKDKKSRAFLFAFIGFIAYFILIAEYNIPHYYYQLPLIPIAALCVGRLAFIVIEWSKKDANALLGGLFLVVLSMGALAVFSFQTARPWYDQNYFTATAVEGLKQVIEPGSIVIMNAPAWSDTYYYMDVFVPHVVYDKGLKKARYAQDVRERIKIGAKYAVWLKFEERDVAEYNQVGTIIADSPLYTVWKLDPSQGRIMSGSAP